MNKHQCMKETATPLRTLKLINKIKQSGVAPKGTSMGKQDEGNGLWANIHAKRRRGERMRKKGEKGAPSPEAMARAKAASENVTTANIPNPADTAMGPKFKTSLIHDRRKRKGAPKLLKRFADYYTEKGIG